MLDTNRWNRLRYTLWAPLYEETAVSALEDRVVSGLGSDARGAALLDVGCGTGRRLRNIRRMRDRYRRGTRIHPADARTRAERQSRSQSRGNTRQLLSMHGRPSIRSTCYNRAQ